MHEDIFSPDTGGFDPEKMIPLSRHTLTDIKKQEI